MSVWSRIANVFRGDRLTREIEEELRGHLDEAARDGRDVGESRRAFGSVLRWQEQCRDAKLCTWFDSLRADVAFGWRRLLKKKATSAAAVLSLGLALGASIAAFRLIDALLLRPLPVAHPERLYVMSFEAVNPADGKVVSNESCAYPMFRTMRALVKSQAELLAVSYIDRVDLTYGTDQETERANLQHVSGWMFDAFGLRPAAGRLLTENDDLVPGAHPYAVLSHDYWKRRFAENPEVVGRTFRLGRQVYEIVGVTDGPFTGTETGTATDIFVPTMMMQYNATVRSDYNWFRTFVRLAPGEKSERLREKLQAAFHGFLQERAGSLAGVPARELEALLSQKLLLMPAAAGASGMQKEYRVSLAALAVLVALVLLIACANVANLMTAEAAARAREMALRVSIGAGRRRLVQLVLVESTILALAAAVVGVAVAWWSAPFVVGRIGQADQPAHLVLPADWRVAGFGLALIFGVSLVLGLAPALRASAVNPAGALRGGEDPRSRRRLMHLLIAAQVGFCFVVHLTAGLLVATFERLANQPTGFSAEHILNLEAVTLRPEASSVWTQIADDLRAQPGVERVSIAEWPLLMGGSWNGFIAVDGRGPSEVACQFLNVSPGWVDTMKIRWIEGRDLRADESSVQVAVVNQAFVRQYLGSGSPVGKSFERTEAGGGRVRYRIAGVVANARYRNLREPFSPVAYFPFGGAFERATFVVRTMRGDGAALLRREVARVRPEFRVSDVRTQKDLNQSHAVRERLLAMLALFFAAVAMLLAGVGLYGVLGYAVLQRRREIGIRVAIGARPVAIARLVMAEVFGMVLAGAAAGLAAGLASARFIEPLLYQVKATDVTMLSWPITVVCLATLLAAAPAVVRALRIDPAAMLRPE